MIQYRKLLYLSFCMLFLSSCNTIQLNQAKHQYEIELSGEFFNIQSSRGKPNCFCDKPGMIKTADSKVYDLCFEDDGIEINCNNIRVKGNFQLLKPMHTERIDCADKKAEFFMVAWYRCY